MIKGIGLDLMIISRMQKSLERPGFAKRVFAKEELEYLETKGNKAESAAGLFAAKEAIVKAMGIGIGAIPLKEIIILHDGMGAPAVKMECEGRMLVSITHMGTTAAAVAIWEV